MYWNIPCSNRNFLHGPLGEKKGVCIRRYFKFLRKLKQIKNTIWREHQLIEVKKSNWQQAFQKWILKKEGKKERKQALRQKSKENKRTPILAFWNTISTIMP